MEKRVKPIVTLLVVATLAGVGTALTGFAFGVGFWVGVGALLVAAPFILLVAGRRLDVFEPVYLFVVCYGALFVLRPAVELGSRRYVAVGGIDPGPQLAHALAIGALGCLGYLLGYYLPLGRRLATRSTARTTPPTTASLATYALVWLAVSFALFGVFILGAGGWNALTTLLAGRSPASAQILTEASGYSYSALLWLASVGVLILAVADRWRSVPAVLGFLLIGLSQVIPFVSGSRSMMLPTLLAVVLLAYLRVRRRPPLYLIAVGGIALFVVGIAAPSQYRAAAQERSVLDGVSVVLDDPGTAAANFVLGGDTAMASDFAVALDYVPSMLDFRFGSTYVEALARPVPRSVWPDKPLALDTQLMYLIWPSLAPYVGFAYSIFAEPYFNFSYIGELGILLLFGLACRWLYEWTSANPRSYFAMGVFALAWPYIIVFVRGGLAVDSHRFVIALAPFALGALVLPLGRTVESRLRGHADWEPGAVLRPYRRQVQRGHTAHESR